MKYNRIDRRMFLQGTGGYLLALPFLSSLLPQFASAQTAAVRSKRFICLWNCNAKNDYGFMPSIAPSTVLASGVRGMPLTSLSGALSPILGTRFDAYRSKMILMQGLDILLGQASAVHSTNSCLGARTQAFPADKLAEAAADEFGETIDQILAHSSKVYPVAPRFRSIHLRVKDGSPDPSYYERTISYRNIGGRIEKIPTQINPLTAFQTLFSGFTPPASGTPQPSAPSVQYNAELKAVDRAYEDLQRIVNSRRISAEDKQRLDAHMTFLSELEERLVANNPMTPPPPATSSCQVPRQPIGRTTLNQISDDHVDVLAAAILCGHTKVATLMLQACTERARYAKTVGSSYDSEFHQVTHHFGDNIGDSSSDAQATAKAAAVECRAVFQWMASKVERLLARLNVVEDSNTGRTFLDNSIVLWGDSMARGHGYKNMSVALFGSGGGYLKTNQYLQYSNRPYNELMITLMMAMGLSPSDWERGGVPGFGNYATTSKRDSGISYTLGDRRSPLPYVRA